MQHQRQHLYPVRVLLSVKVQRLVHVALKAAIEPRHVAAQLLPSPVPRLRPQPDRRLLMLLAASVERQARRRQRFVSLQLRRNDASSSAFVAATVPVESSKLVFPVMLHVCHWEHALQVWRPRCLMKVHTGSPNHSRASCRTPLSTRSGTPAPRPPFSLWSTAPEEVQANTR